MVNLAPGATNDCPGCGTPRSSDWASFWAYIIPGLMGSFCGDTCIRLARRRVPVSWIIVE